MSASSLSDSVGSSGGGIIAARSAHRHGAPVPGSSITYAPPSDTTNLEVLEYPFLTMKTYPPGFIVHLGIESRIHSLFFNYQVIFISYFRRNCKCSIRQITGSYQ